MKRARHIALAGLAATAVVGLGATAAVAATTTVHSGSKTGPAYSGSITASLLGTATVSTSIGSGSCNQSTMNGTINSDGSGLSISGATFSNNGGPCTGSASATITAKNLPWSGGSVTYAPVSGGRDATVTIAHFSVEANVNIFGGVVCDYGGTLTADGYNADNANRPVTSNNQAQVAVKNATVNKTGGSFLCPGSATVTATYQLTGSSGVSLWVTS